MNLTRKTPMLMTWEDDFSQHNELIDEQHRAIITTINAIHFLTLKGDDTHIIKHVMMLYSQLELHFKTEMLILRQNQSPLLADYEDHANLILASLLDRLDAPTDDHQTQLLFSTFKDWWQRHLQLHDSITPFLEDWEGDFCRVAHADSI
jgi:hemerythrin